MRTSYLGLLYSLIAVMACHGQTFDITTKSGVTYPKIDNRYLIFKDSLVVIYEQGGEMKTQMNTHMVHIDSISQIKKYYSVIGFHEADTNYFRSIVIGAGAGGLLTYSIGLFVIRETFGPNLNEIGYDILLTWIGLAATTAFGSYIGFNLLWDHRLGFKDIEVYDLRYLTHERRFDLLTEILSKH